MLTSGSNINFTWNFRNLFRNSPLIWDWSKTKMREEDDKIQDMVQNETNAENGNDKKEWNRNSQNEAAMFEALLKNYRTGIKQNIF